MRNECLVDFKFACLACSSCKVVATLPEVVLPESGRGRSQAWVWYKRLMWHYVMILSINSIVIKEFDKMK